MKKVELWGAVAIACALALIGAFISWNSRPTYPSGSCHEVRKFGTSHLMACYGPVDLAVYRKFSADVCKVSTQACTVLIWPSESSVAPGLPLTASDLMSLQGIYYKSADKVARCDIGYCRF